MGDNKHSTNKNNTKGSKDIILLVEEKIRFFQNVIQKTLLHIQRNKMLDILGISEVNNCINTLFEISNKIKEIHSLEITSNTDNVINVLQTINNELSILFKLFGTEQLEDLLWVCFGTNTYTTSLIEKDKYELLQKYFHPISYKLVTPNSKSDEEKQSKQPPDELLHEKSPNLNCADISLKIKPFHLNVYGIQVIIHNTTHNKSLIIHGVLDDIIIEFLDNKYIMNKINQIKEIVTSNETHQETFDRFLSSLLLKDFLIYGENDIYAKYVGCISNINALNQKTISTVVKDFIASDLFGKRNMIIQFLIKTNKYETQYLAYLLYDLLSNDTNGNIDTLEQTILFDSFPWCIKQYFKEAMTKTIQYTNDLSNFDIQKIPLEQQICLLKVPDSVKEKAMQKLKEVKSKTEDSGSKARQYLDGLLKIPFNIYKREPILDIMSQIKSNFLSLIRAQPLDDTSLKNKYTNLEILHSLHKMKLIHSKKSDDIQTFTNKWITADKNGLVNNIVKINEAIHKHKLSYPSIKTTSKNKNELKQHIRNFIEKIVSNNKEIFLELSLLDHATNAEMELLPKSITEIEKMYEDIHSYMTNVKKTLDHAIHGHDGAKKQIERIIGQWINGQNSGYCFGFEGPPGVGKTSLAKRGLADCLKDADGVTRPFAMIQIGGDSNGSSLHGHNYTYVGSTWGSIVQILIDTKCMNPIILIDEVDKISKTEHGREIIGILTHLLDSTQNENFQDKYFNGIELDLSKALFILSYNDVESIDKILLDRIHRIQFSTLSLEDKIIICKSHILPEIFEKFGLEEMISINDETIKFIIDNYTLEPGVRKLKEKLFEIVGEINLDILKNRKDHYEYPINISIEDIKNNYFKDKHEVRIKKIGNKSCIAKINGMYATTVGTGGTLPIQAKFFPCDKFLDLKLTGLQQEVMRESMHLSLTVAWNLTSIEKQIEVRQKYDNNTNCCGINIHTGDGAVSKDGPSAGCAITCVLYSLFNNIPIKPDFGVTGEILIDNTIGAIGGLNHKILGSLKSDVKSFIFPKENQRDFDEFMAKYKDTDLLKGIQFYPVSTIEEVLNLLLDR